MFPTLTPPGSRPWRLYLHALLVTLACGSEPSADTLEEFWSQFRAAVENDDREAVAAMTRFPLEVKGSNESDPIETYTREEFLGVVYDAMLDQPEYLEVGGSMVERSQREWILDKPDIEPRDQMHEELAFIFSLEISRTSGGWELTRIYLHDPPDHEGLER